MTTPGPNGHHPSQQAAQQAMADQLKQAVAQVEARVTAQAQQNIAAMQEMAARGVRIDPLQVLNARLDVIVAKVAELMGDQGSLWAASCNLAFEQCIAQLLEHAKTEGTKAVLGSGSLLTPGQIRTLAKQTGTFGG